MKCKIYLMILMILFTTGLCNAQEPLMQHYTTNDGLPSNTIHYVYQDSRGFMWFSTELGISRFDGHQFITFTSKEGLPDNEIFKMKEDSYHRCWLFAYNFIPCYIYNDKIYTPKNDALCRQIEQSKINYNDMFFNKDGDFCLGGNFALVVHKDHISYYTDKITNTISCVFSYFIHQKKEYISNGLDIYKIEKGKLSVFFKTGGGFKDYYYEKDHAYSLQNHNKNILIDVTLYKDSCDFKLITLPFKAYSVAGYKADLLWLCTDKGIITYNPSLGLVDTTEILMPDIAINRVFIDSDKNVWYTTVNDGVFMQPSVTCSTYNLHTGLTGDNVLCLGMENQQLLAGYDIGVLDIIGKSKISTIRLFGNNFRNKVRYIYGIGDNELLVGSDNGFNRVNILTGEIRNNPLNLPSQKAAVIKNGNCILGFASGAVIYNIKKDSAYQFTSTRTTAITQDNTGTIWCGTLNGVYTYENKVLTKWDQDPVLSSCRITSMASMGDAGLVIATHTEGLFLWINKKLTHLTEKEGLSSDVCHKVLVDNKGAIWLCTNKGLDKIWAYNNRYNIHHFSQSDGLITDNVNDILLDKDKVYVATSKGIIVFKEGQVSGSPLPKVYILSVRIKDSLINYPGQLILPYNQNNLEINYTGISYTDGRNIRYKYFLEGGSTDTGYTGLSVLNLGSMKPGSYQLFIWASAKNKQWNSQPATFRFTVQSPFWYKSWFLGSSLLLVAGSIFFVYKRRVKHIRHSENEKTLQARKMGALEMQALKAQINPHFMFNVLNAIQSYYNQHDERSANYYMSSFARLTRQTLIHATAHWLNLAEEINMLKTYIELEQMRLNHSFDYELSISPDIRPEQTMIPAMLLQPYVENAINHGLRYLKEEKGRLLLSCGQQGENLCCRIEDNGIGFDKARQLNSRPIGHKSMGMAITQQRVETINQLYNTHITTAITDKQSVNTADHGTVIEIIIPMNISL